MNFVNDVFDVLADTPTYAQLLTTVLAVISTLTFGIRRFFLQGYNPADSTGEAIMIGIIISTIGGGLIAGYRGDGVVTGMVIALGSPVGLAIYLVVAISLEGPSSDSPTWLIYLIVTGFFVVVGGIGYGIGLAARQIL